MKRTGKRIVAILLTAMLAFTAAWLLPVVAGVSGVGVGDAVPCIPPIVAYADATPQAATPAVGDIIYFGRYPQSMLNPSNPTAKPSTGTSGVDWVPQMVKLCDDYDGYAPVFGDPPSGSTAYYKIEPIAWRVLSNTSGQLFLMAEKALDAKPYHMSDVSRTWETCTLRSWLNGYSAGMAGASTANPYPDSFTGKAFTADERDAVATTEVQNPPNSSYGTLGGNPTDDKVFLLSLEEVRNTSYGFHSTYFSEDEGRRAKTTPFARARYAGTDTDSLYSGFGNGWWWLRSPGDSSNKVASVSGEGYVSRSGDSIYDYSFSVRPALFLNPKSIVLASMGSKTWTVSVSISDAEVVCSPNTTEYTGRPITPAVTVTLGDHVLVNGRDYTLSYSGNTNPGIATVTATAKHGSGYTGSVSGCFTITPKLPTNTALQAPIGLNLTAKKKFLLVKWIKPADAAAQQLTGYKIRYRYKMGKKWSKWQTKTVKIGYKTTAKTATATLKKLKSGKTYQVQIRAYKVVGKGNTKQYYYSKWTKGKSKRVK